MEKGLMQTLDQGERVTSSYAEIFFNDEHCEYKKPDPEDKIDVKKKPDDTPANDVWVSPSDVLIGKLDLIPPFTSKIFRGITHKGILEIGDAVLQKEHAKFLKYLAGVLADNDSAWTHIQEQEKIIVAKKVKAIYERIFLRKSKTMQKEMAMFYEDTLRELENHLRCEVRTVLMSTHCSIISDLNKEIREKLQKERQKLEKVLRKRYNNEVKKIKKYYNLLLQNEKQRNNRMINQAICQRNDALKTFCKQIDAENITSTMYVMSTERKKCKMRQFLMENYHSKEIEEKLKTIKEKQDILDDFNRTKRHIMDINKEWEDNIKKILQLFLKFISFSLKLLPEQTTFLLDLEKLVVLQLNEIEKNPTRPASILINSDDCKNMFEFQDPEKPESVCEEGPFVIEGDLSPSIPTPYGSRETLPSHVDLPFFRYRRQFIYAKCQKMEQVKAYLESRRCKCHDMPTGESLLDSIVSTEATSPLPTPTPPITPQSSKELFMVDDIHRLRECPMRGCHKLEKRLSFPNLDDYLDFDEEKYARVLAILGEPAKLTPTPSLTDPKEIVHRELLFAPTRDQHHTIGTQYSSVEDLEQPDVTCNCLDSIADKSKSNVTPEINLNTLLMDRKRSLAKLMHQNPKLLKLFSEESFDFMY